jgi:acyl-lipid omega-6 desaturase (Delta-12 desaturase)
MKAASNTLVDANGMSWQKIVAKYHGPDLRLSIGQLITSFVPYIALWYLMYLSLSYSYAITLLLAVVASGFLLRIFIIFHDCTHGSFFKSRRANEIVGVICGLASFTPFGEWRHRHNLHHATTGNLDKRGWWDIDVLTVKEYLALPPRKQLIYRLYRNPIILFMLGAGCAGSCWCRCRSPSFPRRSACGCSTSSTSSSRLTGSTTRSGTT